MGVLRIAGFAGMWPIRDARALPDNAAVDALNISVGGGAYLRPAAKPLLVKALQASTMTVFRIPLAGANTLVNSHWMEFADLHTDVVRGPLVNDSFQRFYWCSPSTGFRFAAKADILAGSTGLTAGVPAPTVMPTITPIPGTGSEEAENVTRSYVYSFVNTYGEESAPSPPNEATAKIDQDWYIEQMQAPPVDPTRAAYKYTRLYRTVTAETGVTEFYKVVDLPPGQTYYMDRLSDLAVSGNSNLQSDSWGEPPPMDGIALMPNGVFVGFKDNNLYFSENWFSHAWPPEYTLTVDFPIVGLGVFGNTCVVCTTGNPSAVSGVKSNTMSLIKIDAPLPCLSRRSIISAPEGVYYASEEGLVLVGPGGANIITTEIVDRPIWRLNYFPSTIKAMITDGMYTFAIYTGSDDSIGYKMNPQNLAAEGVSRFDMPSSVRNVGVEPWTGKPWVISGPNAGTPELYEWEAPGNAPESYLWLSKEFQYPKPANFAVYQAYFDDSAGAGLHFRAWVTLRGYDGSTARVLVHDTDITASGREVRFPSGFKGDIWEFEFSGTAELQSFIIATSVKELRSA